METLPVETPQNKSPTEQEVRQWAMILHFSQLVGIFVVPVVGFILPIILWQVKRNEMPELDAHGKVITNWLISALIYGVISTCLIIVFIGFPLLGVLGLLGIIFPILGGIKANEGVVWKYPLSIAFLK